MVAMLLCLGIFSSNQGYSSSSLPGQTSTVVLTNTIYNNYIDVDDGNIVWITNTVCGATSYEWFIDGFKIAETALPSLSFDSEGFSMILSLGGCDVWNGRISNGVLSTNLSVRANAGAGNIFTIPVFVSGVSKCKEEPIGGKCKKCNFGDRGDFWTPYNYSLY